MSTDRYLYCTLDEPETRCSECGRWAPWFVAWVERSRAAQGLPAKVTDPAVLHRVAILMGAAR